MAGDVMGPDPVTSAGAEGLGGGGTPAVAPQPAAGTSTATPTPAAGTAVTPGPQTAADLQQQAAQKGAADAQKQTQQNAPEPKAPKGSLGARMIMHVADALGGPRTREVTDPATGQTTTVPIPTNVRALRFLGDLMVGEGAGMAAHGPGHAGQAAILSREAIQKEHQQQTENQQKDLLAKAQVYRDHMTNLLTLQTLGYKNKEALQATVDSNQNSLMNYSNTPTVPDMTEDQPNGVTDIQYQQMRDDYIKGGGKGTDLIEVPLRVVARMDEKDPTQQAVDKDGKPAWTMTYKIFKDGPTKLSPEQAVQFGHLPNMPPLAEGQPMKASQINQLQTQVSSITGAAHSIISLGKDNGVDTSKVPGRIEDMNPNQARSLKDWNMALAHGDGDPTKALQYMTDKAQDTNPIVQMFGGLENVKKISNNIAATQAAAVETAKAEAKAATPEGKLEQQTKEQELKNKRLEQKKLEQDVASGKSVTDSLGHTITPPEGGLKEYNKRQNSFKKDADTLAKTEGTFNQFQDILNDINSGKDITGAQSVVALFNAIGISATPLQGMGFRINNNTIEEHAEARGLGQSLYQKFLGLKNGDVITPQQVKDYATIAMRSRHDAYVNKINEVTGQGISPDFLLPRGNGRKVDPTTASIFYDTAEGATPKEKSANAQAAAKKMGWSF